MKKVSTICLLLMISIINFSFAQKNEFPPIQKFLDRVKVGVHSMTENEAEVKQKLKMNSFIYYEKDNTEGYSSYDKYENINWLNYIGISFSEQFEYKNFKYIRCTFAFKEKITYIFHDDEYKDEPQKRYKFSVIILVEDKDAFLKVINDWEKTRK